MALQLKDLVDHPYTFAMGVGVANGLLAVGRGKKIDMPTALTLSVILGLGEMALVVYEPESERHYSLTSVGIYSVLGVLTGVLPFVTRGGAHGEEAASPLLMASNAQPGTLIGEAQTAVSGWSRSRPRRAVAPRRRRA